jgi:hypothetical protein
MFKVNIDTDNLIKSPYYFIVKGMMIQMILVTFLCIMMSLGDAYFIIESNTMNCHIFNDIDKQVKVPYFSFLINRII